MSKVKFNFSKELKTDLRDNAKQWDKLLFAACLEGKSKEVKATLFCETLRKSGFRCGTGPARAAFKVVREGGDIKAMVTAVTIVKSKRKVVKTTTDTGTTTTDTGTTTTDTGTADTLVGALTAAAHAARNGNLAVVETWLVKAQAMLATAKLATAQAVKKMGGVA